jgi:WD40 repeat protein
VLRGHGDYTNAEFSPDGRWIVTSEDTPGTGSAVRVWDAETGREHMVVKEKGFPLKGRFSPDSQRIVTNEETVWNVATCEEMPLPGIGALDLSPDGKQIVAVDDDSNKVGLWDAETCESHGIVGPTLEAHYAKFSPDGQRIATVNLIDETTRLWSRRRPEYWWGIAWLPEFWVAYFTGGALLVIAARNLRRRFARPAAVLPAPSPEVESSSQSSSAVEGRGSTNDGNEDCDDD